MPAYGSWIATATLSGGREKPHDEVAANWVTATGWTAERMSGASWRTAGALPTAWVCNAGVPASQTWSNRLATIPCGFLRASHDIRIAIG